MGTRLGASPRASELPEASVSAWDLRRVLAPLIPCQSCCNLSPYPLSRMQHYALSAKASVQTLYPYGVTIDSQGMVWFTESGTNRLGRLDPTTGAMRLFAAPDPRAAHGNCQRCTGLHLGYVVYPKAPVSPRSRHGNRYVLRGSRAREREERALWAARDRGGRGLGDDAGGKCAGASGCRRAAFSHLPDSSTEQPTLRPGHGRQSHALVYRCGRRRDGASVAARSRQPGGGAAGSRTVREKPGQTTGVSRSIEAGRESPDKQEARAAQRDSTRRGSNLSLLLILPLVVVAPVAFPGGLLASRTIRSPDDPPCFHLWIHRSLGGFLASEQMVPLIDKNNQTYGLPFCSIPRLLKRCLPGFANSG